MDNQSDQPATIDYDGRTLTIAVPAGVAPRVQFRTPPSSCAPVDGQPNVIACAPVLGRPAAFVTFSTVGSSASMETLELFPGCNNATVTWPNGMPTSEVAAAVTPASALDAIWRFDSATQRFRGYSPLPNAPNDLTTVSWLDTVFLCMREPGTLTRPAA